MGFLDAILGRSKPAQANLDALFALPAVGVGVEAETGMRPTGTGSVCFRSAEGAGFAEAIAEVEQLMSFGDTSVSRTTDSYNYTWLTASASSNDISELVTALHAANSTLRDAGFGTSLLCSTVVFQGVTEGQPKTMALVYLYKRGTFYPFAPTGNERRDNAFELRVKGMLESELPMEADLSRWFPIWGAPGL